MSSLLAEKTEARPNPRQEESARAKGVSLRRTKAVTVARGIAGLVTVALIWEFVPRLGLVDSYLIPPLHVVLREWWTIATDGSLLKNVRASVVRSGLGFVVAIVLAIPLGAAIAWYRPVREFFTPVLELFRSTAALAILPVFTLVLGIGETSKIAIVAYACLFPVLLNTISGVRSVDPLLLRSPRRSGSGRRRPSARWCCRRRCRRSSRASASPAPPRSWCSSPRR